jgi:hypothetical protein
MPVGPIPVISKITSSSLVSANCHTLGGTCENVPGGKLRSFDSSTLSPSAE